MPLFSAFGPEPVATRLQRGDGRLLVTSAALVVDQGWRTGSLVDAPVQRLCGAEVPMPYAVHLEQAAMPATRRGEPPVVEPPIGPRPADRPRASPAGRRRAAELGVGGS